MLFATLQTKINTLGITDIFFLILKVERVNGKRIEFVSHRTISLIAIPSTVMFLNSLAGRWPSDRVLRSGDNSWSLILLLKNLFKNSEKNFSLLTQWPSLRRGPDAFYQSILFWVLLRRIKWKRAANQIYLFCLGRKHALSENKFPRSFLLCINALISLMCCHGAAS